MRKYILLLICFLGMFGMNAQSFTDPWTPQQLLSTKVLSTRITQNKMDQTILINIGPDAVIKNSFNLGPVQNKGNQEKLQNYLKKVSKDKEVVLYCGCCPFEKCPNIRPAFKSLIAMGYKNTKLLNIPKNIKVDWIDKGYPVN
ncbi:rhodanese-like domain-containing protein [Paenimyroides aestuarii]|uniref:Rhodanese-like domain-containing protein n=1 Tax=Paenimyroides aestuarii TaxID=2968490 RepID=A0ABY5NTB4_9FLAO|nr:rhodanese-like domain-containing protein [Paenimyroides aestuarii]UUV21584.1 rhodanese-like domain-containing protein [Paenimyroides aestuarii]